MAAINAPNRPPMTNGRLADYTDKVVRALKALGISRNDLTAMVVPNGMIKVALNFLRLHQS